MSETRNNLDATSKEPPVRKPYHRPTLEVHGTIREVTEHVGNAGTHPDPPPHAGGLVTTR
jgi:hypothetical protein